MGFTTYEAHAEYTSMNVTQSLEASGVIALGMLRRMSALDPDFEYFSVPVPISFEVEVREISNLNYLGLQPVVQSLPVHATVNVLMKRAIQRPLAPSPESTDSQSIHAFARAYQAAANPEGAAQVLRRPIPRQPAVEEQRNLPPLQLPPLERAPARNDLFREPPQSFPTPDLMSTSSYEADGEQGEGP